MKTGVAAAGGAMGSLAGCLGGSGDGDGDSGGSNSDGSNESSGNVGGGQSEVTIGFLSATVVENSTVDGLFKDSMGRFEQQNENISVDLTGASYDDIQNKLGSTVSAGNPPAIAEAGTLALEYFGSGDVPNHGQWYEGSDNIPEGFTQLNKDVSNFRGEWWCGGAVNGSARGMGIRPKLLSQVGVTDPFTELATWSGTRDVINRLDEKFPDTIAWEETGTPPDLESYWGEARTAYTNGDDPWIRGDPTDPDVLIDQEPRTDGMVKNCVTLADQYSSEEVASRADENLPALVMTDRVAMHPHASQSWIGYTSVKEDATFGWQNGEGDYMLVPLPKVDPDYGTAVSIPELEGVEGEHAGHVSAMQNSHSIFDVDDQRKMDAAWTLNEYMITDETHMLSVFGRGDPAIPQYNPMLEVFEQELQDPPQVFTQALEMVQEYGGQYTATGALWDVEGTNQIRWTDIAETMSQGLAGQHPVDDLPGIVRERILSTLQG
jgi:ABC-type glycerol-3-phosphate transport system substrate-binding protein